MPTMNMLKVAGLVSGGKDSCFNMMCCVIEGHDLVALANLKPPDDIDELDSHTFQTVGHQAIEYYAEAMMLPLHRRTTTGKAIATGVIYTPTEGDEVEDLYELLKEVKEKHNVEAVSVGAILSDYQRNRVENVCARLGLVPLCYLWRRKQEELLDEILNCEVDAIIIKVASFGLTPQNFLGKNLRDVHKELLKLHKTHHLNVCGEGGEYETLTLDSPLFVKKIVIDEVKHIQQDNNDIAPVAHIKIVRMHLEDKEIGRRSRWYMRGLPMYRRDFLYQEMRWFDPEAKELCELTESLTLEESEKALHQPEVLLDNSSFTCKNSLFISHSLSLTINDHDTVATIAKKMQDKGIEIENVVQVHLYLSKIKDFSTVNALYKEIFFLDYPSRICVAAELSESKNQIQFDCLAQRNCSLTRNTMHVQSLSHWAPACIGPYSQLSGVGPVLFLAGQIGLIPATLELIKGDVKQQARLALRHVCRILEAYDVPNENILYAVCYLTNKDNQNLVHCCLDEVLGFTPPHCFICVSGLPKNAEIEWEIVAAKGCIRESYNQKNRQIDCLESCISCCATIHTLNVADLENIFKILDEHAHVQIFFVFDLKNRDELLSRCSEKLKNAHIVPVKSLGNEQADLIVIVSEYFHFH